MAQLRYLVTLLGCLLFVLGGIAYAELNTLSLTELKDVLAREDYQALKPSGVAVIEPLLTLYNDGGIDTRRRVANALYYLSIKSVRAREVLMQDVHTTHSQLRLAVQWALGRVSDDAVVVQVLLDNMENDPNPLFRDKAACALAYDQVHLSEKQQVLLLEGLVRALENDKDDVRRIALQALQIRTGQTKDFVPEASVEARQPALQRWQAWVAEYRKNIYGE
jgi:HEAT repeat protein